MDFQRNPSPAIDDQLLVLGLRGSMRDEEITKGEEDWVHGDHDPLDNELDTDILYSSLKNGKKLKGWRRVKP